MVGPAEQGHKPRAAVTVVLGASNVARHLPMVVQRARRLERGPHAILVAAGRGRSFGVTASFLGRALPAIEASGLWARFEQEAAGGGPVRALISDVGNDILYGATPDEIAAWVERALLRLRERGARTIVAGLPRARLERLSRATFDFWKRVFFPGRRLDFDTAQAAIEAVDLRLRELARAFGAAHVEPAGEWYGLDPIHVRARSARAAWDALLADWGPAVWSPPAAPLAALRLLAARAERGAFLGRPWLRRGPVASFAEGTRVHCF